MLFCIVCLWLEFICIQDFYLEKVFFGKENRKEKKRKENPRRTLLSPAPHALSPGRSAPSPPCLVPLTAGPRPSLSDARAPHVSRHRFFLPCRSRVSLWQPKEIPPDPALGGTCLPPTPIKLLPHPAPPSLHLISETEP